MGSSQAAMPAFFFYAIALPTVSGKIGEVASALNGDSQVCNIGACGGAGYRAAPGRGCEEACGIDAAAWRVGVDLELAERQLSGISQAVGGAEGELIVAGWPMRPLAGRCDRDCSCPECGAGAARTPRPGDPWARM